MKLVRYLTCAWLLGISSPAWPQAQRVGICLERVDANGSNQCSDISSTNPLPTSATFTPSGTQDVNIAQVLGAAPSLTNPLFVSPATGSVFTVTGGGTAGTAATGVVTIQGIASMTPVVVSNGGTFAVQATLSAETTKVIGTVNQGTSPWVVSNGGTFAVQAALNTTPSIANGNGVIIAPTALATAGIAPVVSTAAESNHVLKGSAGNLYTLTATIGATSGYLMIFDATSLPANGAVTPKYCLPIASNGTFGGTTLSWNSGPPLVFATGITAGFSTTGCFTLTASTTANFFGQVQ